jgi:hypothetical protein
MATKKVKKYEGGGLLHENIPGMYNTVEARFNPKAKEDVEAIPVAEPRRMEAQEESDPLGDKIREIQASRSAPAPRRAAPTSRRAAPIADRAAPTADRADVDTALAESAAQAQMEYADNSAPARPRRSAPKGSGSPYSLPSMLNSPSPSLHRGRPRNTRAASSDTYKKGGSVKSGASKRADGCAVRGKTKGRMV